MNYPRNAARDLTLDFVKGVLVVFMVIYHVMNIVSTAGPEAFGYIRFVSGSFVLISGYIISRFYGDRFQEDRVGTSKRLLVRGMKVLLVFTVLNVLINLTGVGNPNKAQLGLQQFLHNFGAIYVSGDPRYASFQILLPIAYLLIASPAFLLLSKQRLFFAAATLTILVWSSLFEVESLNFEFLLVGVIGLCVGMVHHAYEGSFFIRRRSIIVVCLVVFMYFMGYLSRNSITYLFGVIIIIKLFYDLGKTTPLTGNIAKAIVLFGQYSLVCYIAQIIFIQVLFRLSSRHKWELGYETTAIFLATNAFLLAMCALLDILRDRYRFVDRSYRFIFS